MAGKEITCAATHQKCTKSCQWRGRGGIIWDAGNSIINSFSSSCGESQNFVLIRLYILTESSSHWLMEYGEEHIAHQFCQVPNHPN